MSPYAVELSWVDCMTIERDSGAANRHQFGRGIHQLNPIRSIYPGEALPREAPLDLLGASLVWGEDPDRLSRIE